MIFKKEMLTLCFIIKLHELCFLQLLLFNTNTFRVNGVLVVGLAHWERKRK